jgi:hypothetical protein
LWHGNSIRCGFLPRQFRYPPFELRHFAPQFGELGEAGELIEVLAQGPRGAVNAGWPVAAPEF